MSTQAMSSKVAGGYNRAGGESASEGGEVHGHLQGMVQRVREGFGEHLAAFRELLSDEEVRAQREFVARILRDPEENVQQLERLLEDYASAEARQRREATMGLYEDGVRRLQEARSAKIISEKSYKEWMRDWFQNRGLSASEKTKSLRGSLSTYLSERGEIAREREKVLRDPRLEKVTDPKLQAEIRFLKDDHEYFDTLSFSQRKNLIDRVRASLAVQEGGPEYQKLRGLAEKMLQDATKTPQPALHRDKVGTWLRRIFESGASPEQIQAFLDGKGGDGSLQKLIGTWRMKAVEFWTIRKDKAFTGVKAEFVKTGAFLWMHYDERVAYVGRMREQRDRALGLRSRAAALLARSSHALGSGGRERWLHEYVFNGRYTLPQLESIIGGNLTERLENKVAILRRFEEASKQAKTFKGIRGMPIPEKSIFLNTKYAQQATIVREMELRLDHLRRQRPDFLRIRSFMDRKDWEGALALIAEARKKEGLTHEDETHMHSMEQFIALRRPQDVREGQRVESTRDEAEEVDRLIDSASPNLQRPCKKLCEKSSESISAMGWASYNRDWCNKHGYLDPEREHQAIEKGKAQALTKERRKKSQGVVSENIQGETAEREYIELSRSAPTNVCVDLADDGAVNAFAETMHLHRKDSRALYWTNAIFHSNGTPMDLAQQRTETQKMYQMRTLLRRLEAKGQIYRYKGKAEDMTVTLPSSPGKTQKDASQHTAA